MPDHTRNPVAAGRLVAVLSALSLGLLTGCGGTAASGGNAASTRNDKGPVVASIAASPTDPAGSAAPAPSASPSAERPLIRRDTSPEERDRLMLVYSTCLKDHGVAMAGGLKWYLDPNKPSDQAAQAACASKQPEDYKDRLARTDPRYADYQRAWIQCMKSKGLKVTAKGTMFEIDDSQAAASGTSKIIDECEAVAFAGK
jgi:hypothetical protein